MARLLAAQVAPAFAHPFTDIAITHLGAVQAQAERGEVPFQPQIRHDGGHDAAARKPPRAVPEAGDGRQDLVAIDDLAQLIDQGQPVGVAVQGNAQIGTAFSHQLGQASGRGGAARMIYVESIGADAGGHHLSAELPQHGGRDLVGSAMGAIDGNAQAIEAEALREAGLGGFDVAARRILEPARAPQPGRPREGIGQVPGLHQRLDLGFLRVGELQAIRAEQLDAVILIGVVARRYHHPEIRAQAAREHGDGRRGQGPDDHHIHARADEAGGECRFQHVPRQARILADHHAMAMRAAVEELPRRLTEAQRRAGIHWRRIRRAADAIGAEHSADGPVHGGGLPLLRCGVHRRVAGARLTRARATPRRDRWSPPRIPRDRHIH